MMYRRIALVLIIAALAGCNNEKNRNAINERRDQSRQGLLEAKNPAPPKTYNPLAVSNKIWAGNASLRMRRGVPLPGRLEGAKGVTLVSAEPMPLNEIANAIGTQIGIPVRIAAGTAGATTATGMSIAYEGPLSGLLDHVASYHGINWRYDGSAINFARFETRVFVIEMLPGEHKIKEGVKEDGGGDSGGSSGGSSSSGTSSLSQSNELEMELKAWEELKETVVSMLGGVGSVVLAPSSGTITVTTTPEIMRTVAKFVEEENKRLSHQIAINVDIYKVELGQGSNFNVSFSEFLTKWADISAIYAGPTGVVASVAGAPTDFGTLTTAILPYQGGAMGSSPNGINAIFTALSSIGDATRVAQFPMTTLNNKPVSRRVGRDRAYVASVQNTTSTTGDTTTSTITPATIREGFNLQLTPRLLDDGRIMLQYSLSLTDLVQIRGFGAVNSAGLCTSDNCVQLPETISRVFVQQSLLKSGATLVLAGVEDEQVAQNSQGVGDPFNYLFGGGSSNSKSHSMMFIAITPQVIDVPGPEKI